MPASFSEDHIRPDSPALIDADELSSPLFLSPARVSELPMPARHLIDVDSYHYTIGGTRALSLVAQLGCPFECGFCGGRNSPFLRRVRTRPSASVVAEMVHLYKRYGVRGFMMYDDELNVNPGMPDLMSDRQDGRAIGHCIPPPRFHQSGAVYRSAGGSAAPGRVSLDFERI